MSAVWMRARAELRARWRAWLGLSLLVALFFGPALSALAGARRTNSVYDRFLKDQRAWDVMILDASRFAPILWKPDYPALERLPYVTASARVFTGNFLGFSFVGDENGRIGTQLNKAKVLQGRLPRADAADEIAVPVFQTTTDGDPILRANKHILATAPVGSTVTLREPCFPPDPRCTGTPPGIDHRLTIVGRILSPFDYRPNEFDAMGLVSPALVKHPPPFVTGSETSYGLSAIALRFMRPSDVSRFDRDLAMMTNGKAVTPLKAEVNTRAVNSSARLQGMAVGLLAVFAGLTAILLMAQTLARQTVLESDEHPTLHALGMSRSQTFILGVMRAAGIAGTGAVLAGLAAWLSSGLFPFGIFRIAETHTGPRFDVLAMVLAPIAVIVVAIVGVAIPAWRSASRTVETMPSTPSRTAGALARAGAPATAVAGVRLALERGRGRSAVPVRSTIAIVTLGTAAIVAALIVSSSIAHLLDTPLLYGKTWDKVVTYNDPRGIDDTVAKEVAAQPEIEAYAVADIGAPYTVDGRRTGGLSIRNLKGSLYPPILSGRAPAAADEVLLGVKTLRSLGKHVDLAHPDTIRIGIQGLEGSIGPIKIVGTAAIPPVNNFARFGEGIVATGDLPLQDLIKDQGDQVPLPSDSIARFRPGADPVAVIARVAKKFHGLEVGDDFARRPSDVVDFGRVQGMPLILSGVLAVIGVLSLAHAITSAIRRRRRDLAILKTIGFVRAQVRRAVAWQSSTLIVAAVALGIPIGIVGGRALWNVIAGSVGVVPSARIPAVTVALLAPAALLLANVIATFPGRTAARTQPALVLRAE